jgi:hypothetical protein
MKFWEAMKALQEGKKVRSISWIGRRAHMDKTSFAEDMSGVPANQLQNYLDDELELYKEPQKTHSFSEVVKGLKEGKKFKRKEWGDWFLAYSHTTYLEGKGIPHCFTPFTMEDFEATDWIEVK